MNEKCHRYPPVSRADTGNRPSRRFGYRQRGFRLENGDTKTRDMTGRDENRDGVFLMNRFYGEETIRPMIGCIRKAFTGDIGQMVVYLLEQEVLERNGYIRGDALLELLKDGLGLEWAVSLIGQTNRFDRMGLYGDNIVARLPVSDCSGMKTRICRGCVRKKAGKEKANWKKNR